MLNMINRRPNIIAVEEAKKYPEEDNGDLVKVSGTEGSEELSAAAKKKAKTPPRSISMPALAHQAANGTGVASTSPTGASKEVIDGPEEEQEDGSPDKGTSKQLVRAGSTHLLPTEVSQRKQRDNDFFGTESSTLSLATETSDLILRERDAIMSSDLSAGSTAKAGDFQVDGMTAPDSVPDGTMAAGGGGAAPEGSAGPADTTELELPHTAASEKDLLPQNDPPVRLSYDINRKTTNMVLYRGEATAVSLLAKKRKLNNPFLGENGANNTRRASSRIMDNRDAPGGMTGALIRNGDFIICPGGRKLVDRVHVSAREGYEQWSMSS